MNVTWRDRLRYRFDLTLARGTPALIAWLMAATAAMVGVLALVVHVLDIGPKDESGATLPLGSAIWEMLMRALDAGNVAGDNGPAYIAATFTMTLAGIFVVSILIGLINSGIESKIDELRKGRSVVCETEHTVIVGYNAQIFGIISEIALANKSRKHAAIAVLADNDKTEMEDEIRARLPDLGNTRVVCRTGSPIDPVDLAIVNPDAARSIIVLAPDGDNPDAHVIKAILALTNQAGRKEGKYHIVAEIRDPRNLDAARLAGRDEAQLLPTEQLLSQITVQTCRQAGLSVVFTELLDFDGDEIYMKSEPSLAGKTFRDALFAYETSTVMGVRGADGKVTLLPPMATKLAADDQLIVVSQDDDTIVLSDRGDRAIDESVIAARPSSEVSPESVLVLGWNRRAPVVVSALDGYVAPGSRVVVVADYDVEEEVKEVASGLKNLTCEVRRGDTTNRRVLDEVTKDDYEHVITLSYSDSLDPQEADARTLVTLLQLRDIESQQGERFSVVSEMLDLRNRQLAQVAKADDFIVSDKLVSLMLAQVSENRDLAAVFAELFSSEGAELYTRPASDYVALHKPLDFYTVLESAARRGEAAIGYRLASGGPDFGVKVNPKKSDELRFAEGDAIIVLAES
jgi:ion channel POLLUX/CASTOR